MADLNSKLEIGVTTGPIRGSRKIHVPSPTMPEVRVAMRAIDLEPSSGEPPLRRSSNPCHSGSSATSASSWNKLNGMSTLTGPGRPLDMVVTACLSASGSMIAGTMIGVGSTADDAAGCAANGSKRGRLCSSAGTAAAAASAGATSTEAARA